MRALHKALAGLRVVFDPCIVGPQRMHTRICICVNGGCARVNLNDDFIKDSTVAELRAL